MNSNMVPPPPLPPLFPAGNREAPRIIQNQAPASIDPMRLADQMGRLNMNVDRSPPGTRQISKVPRQYEGYTFFKADAIPGQRPTWNQAERTKMHLSQGELLKMVQKRSKKIPASQQYQNLTKVKRTHVDQLIEELRRIDPRAEWHCVYVKVDEKPVTGKGSRPGDYETVSMDVVVMRKPSSTSLPQSPFDDFVDLGSPIGNRKFDSPFPDEDFTIINRGMGDNAPFPRPNGPPNQLHPPMNGFQQSPPPQIHQHLPPMSQGQAMGGPPVFQGPKPGHQTQPGGFHPPPGMHSPPPTGPSNKPEFEILHDSRASPQSPDAHRPKSRSGQMHPRFSLPLNNQFQTPGYPKTKEIHKHIAKSPKKYHHEPDWGHESSDLEDDESMMFDLEGGTSGTEDTDSEIHEAFLPTRGSLSRRSSPIKYSLQEPLYRPHNRHQSSRYSLDKKHGHKRYPSGQVDLIPVSRTASKRLERPHSKEIITYGSCGHPTVIHGPDTPLDKYIQDRLRGGRARNDIRTRMLDDREARLEYRENMLDFHSRMLDERLDSRPLYRQLPLVEPYYHGRHLH